MDIVFTVSSAVQATENTSVSVGGQNVTATIPALEVELVSDHYGSLRLRFVGAEKDAALSLFKVNSKHTWTII